MYICEISQVKLLKWFKETRHNKEEIKILNYFNVIFKTKVQILKGPVENTFPVLVFN